MFLQKASYQKAQSQKNNFKTFPTIISWILLHENFIYSK